MVCIITRSMINPAEAVTRLVLHGQKVSVPQNPRVYVVALSVELEYG